MANTYTQKTITWGGGKNTLYAGTPLDTNGKPANDNTAIGILAEDLHSPDRTAKVLTAGEWDESQGIGSGIIISFAAKQAMSDITFLNPPAVSLEAVLSEYVKTTEMSNFVQKTDLATTEAAGVVKQGEAVEDVADAPTKAEFNGLLGALRTAGILATQAEEEEAQE